MSNVIKLHMSNAILIPDEIIFNDDLDIAEEINNALKKSPFNYDSPIWFFTATIGKNNKLENIWEGNFLDVFDVFFEMREQGYNDYKLFLAQERA